MVFMMVMMVMVMVVVFMHANALFAIFRINAPQFLNHRSHVEVIIQMLFSNLDELPKPNIPLILAALPIKERLKHRLSHQINLKLFKAFEP